MPVQTSYPGVYVQEVPSGVRTIAGVSTSVAVFIGRTKTGPINKPLSCTSYTEFVRKFSDSYAHSELARSVKLFFLNGGTNCYVVRVANGAQKSAVTLKNASAVEVLTFTAKSPGLDGESIRLNVTYNGQQPEATFNLELFRWIKNSGGQMVKSEMENYQGLSMDPLNAKFAPTYVSQNSSLVDVKLAATAPAASPGYSQSGRPLPKAAGNFRTALQSIITAGSQDSFRISVNGNAFVNVDLSTADLTGNLTEIKNAIQSSINTNLPSSSQITVSLESGPAGPPQTSLIRIISANGDVYIQPALSNDLSRALMLGTAQGGLEVTQYSDARPQPNAIVFKISDLETFGNMANNAFDTITINGTDIELSPPFNIDLGAGAMYQDGVTPAPSISGNSDGIREKFSIIADAINNKKANNPPFNWTAQLWGSRLAIIPADGGDNAIGTLTTSKSGGGGDDIGPNFEENVRYYSLGMSGAGGFQAGVNSGNDGSAPILSDYTNTFPILDQEVDIFNLMILPADDEHTPALRSTLWGPTSVFCQEKRAFLLMDPPTSWNDAQSATNPTTGVNSLRIGLVKDYSAIFFPRVTIKENGLDINIGPSGAIAGLMARIDSSRGVWKAPAGTEADIRGINGLEYRFSDRDNGQLNPKAVNTLRIFPNGIVNWGARTMDGDDDFASEYKYIPIRRTALYIEESLYRGLKWVVFEPNDEPLWAQIRLNVGAFMHNLFRQGAFQGTKKQDAYFVKCDSETTTQNDINLGVVNVWVGFAPLKPAEFVILYLQQMTGQIQV